MKSDLTVGLAGASLMGGDSSSIAKAEFAGTSALAKSTSDSIILADYSSQYGLKSSFALNAGLVDAGIKDASSLFTLQPTLAIDSLKTTPLVPAAAEDSLSTSSASKPQRGENVSGWALASRNASIGSGGVRLSK